MGMVCGPDAVPPRQVSQRNKEAGKKEATRGKIRKEGTIRAVRTLAGTKKTGQDQKVVKGKSQTVNVTKQSRGGC